MSSRLLMVPARASRIISVRRAVFALSWQTVANGGIRIVNAKDNARGLAETHVMALRDAISAQRLRSARMLPEPARSYYLQIARAEAESFEAYPLQIREDVRATVRAELAREEQQRLREKASKLSKLLQQPRGRWTR